MVQSMFSVIQVKIFPSAQVLSPAGLSCSKNIQELKKPLG